jgi:D-beta-D-heptose 7-phosphate kinase/D-beta-D-heptose 1-phosphate adenosyltransferase
LTRIESARLGELLGRATGVRILVVGDLIVDRYVSGRVDRVSPEAPVPVVLVEEERAAIGGAGNVATNVAALGAACSVVGCVGDDLDGSGLIEALETQGVDSSGVCCDPSRPTTVKTRVHARHHQIVRFDREVERDVDSGTAAELVSSLHALVPDCHAVVVQDYNKGVLTPPVIDAVTSAAGKAGVPIVVDPKRRGFFGYAGATVFKPNERELEDALGDFVHPEDEAWMEATRRRLACRHLLVTLGDRGMALQTEEGRLVRLPTAAQSVYDVSGAGDTVVAALAVMLAAGADVSEAAFVANHAAAVEVGRAGVQTVTPDEIAAHISAWPD